MINIEDVLGMWKKDSTIDEMNLDISSIKSAKLHSKYLEMFTISKLQLQKKENELNVLLKNKWLHYHGKLSKDEIDALGWSYDPLNGLKVLKSDMNYFFNSDKDIQLLQSKIAYIKTTIETLDEILQNIKWRHTNISNIIKWKQFVSGA